MKQSEVITADVLIVDDNDQMRQKCVEVLTGAGFTAETAENGLIGLQRCLQGRYRLLLTDLEMPSLHGWGLIARIRATQALHGMPIVAMTGRSDRELVSKVVSLGVQGYLLKPFEPEALVAKVRSLLSPPALPESFALCPRCHREWNDAESFLADGELTPTSFCADVHNPPAGRLVFEHNNCGGDISLNAASLFTQAAVEGEAAHSRAPLKPIPAALENRVVAKILEQMASWG